MSAVMRQLKVAKAGDILWARRERLAKAEALLQQLPGRCP